MKPPFEVLVCGSNYGRSYLSALKRAGDGYRTAALLARGSRRSKELAEQQGIPLLTRIEHLPDSIDIACAAICPSASHLIPELSGRGIHVLCEHPQRVPVIEESLKAAAHNDVRFHANGHFGDLGAPSLFLEKFAELRTEGGPWFFHVATVDRFLCQTIDILARAMGGLEECTVDTTRQEHPYLHISSVIDGVESVFQIRVTGSNDEDLLETRISAGFVGGILMLESLAGPVTFTDDLSLDSTTGGQREFIEGSGPFNRDAMHEQRIAANVSALESLTTAGATGHTPRHQQPSFILGVGRVWEKLEDRLLEEARPHRAPARR